MPYIDNWLVLGPIFNPAQQTPNHFPGDGHPLAADILAEIDTAGNLDPGKLTTPSAAGPADGDAFVYTSKIFPDTATRWQPLRFQDMDWDNLTDIHDNIHQKLVASGFAYRHHVLAFFLVYVNSPADLTTKLMVRSDDGIRVWLNGDEVKDLAFIGDRDMEEAENGAEVKLTKGENRLLCVVAETHVEWSFSARFADEADLTITTAKGTEPAIPSGTVITNLDLLSDRYAIFEEDQVLTHFQLNSVTSWFEDQDRLSRLLLSGVGIGCGLRASFVNGLITVTKGFGLTTDGDLLYLQAGTVFDRFRSYDRSRPEYLPFKGPRNADGSYRIYELLAVGEKGHADAASLNVFKGRTGKAPEEMAILFYMENFVTDSDVCSVTGCDNLGKQCRNRPTFLLMHRDDVKLLGNAVPSTRDDLYDHCTEVPIFRPRFSLAMKQTKDLISAYGEVCVQLIDELGAGMKAIGVGLWRALLPDETEDPLTRYTARVLKLREKFLSGTVITEYKNLKSVTATIQYFYDFLKDLAETFNDLRELLCHDYSVCCPDRTLFPKHLVLGGISGSIALRTGFYPSPLLGDHRLRMDRARFLARKLMALMELFELQRLQEIVVTPSMGEEHLLEERAIPFYYDDSSIGDFWAFGGTRKQRKRSMEEKRRGSLRISQYPFFRIEGHLGEDVADALKALNGEITRQGLPIAVTAVQLAEVASDPVHPTRYSDLHRVYDALRRVVYDNLSEALNDLKKAEASLKTVNSAQTKVLLGLVTTAITSATSLQKKLEGTYSDHRQAGNWQDDMNQLLEKGRPLLQYLDLARQQSVHASIESMLSGRELLLLDRLRRHLDEKELNQNNRLLFANFIKEHPGLDHLAGAPPGGTFVLIYDRTRSVVADAMLPYHVSQSVEEESAWLEYTFLPFIFFGETLTTLFTMTAQTPTTMQKSDGGVFTHIDSIKKKREEIMVLREQATTAPEEERVILQQQAAAKEQELAKDMSQAVDYVAMTQPTTEETNSVMMSVLMGMDVIENKDTLAATTAKMQDMSVMTQSASLKQSLAVLMPAFNARIHA